MAGRAWLSTRSGLARNPQETMLQSVRPRHGAVNQRAAFSGLRAGESSRSGDACASPASLDTRMGSAPARQRVGPRAPRGARSFGEADLLDLVDRAPDVVFRYRLHPPGFDFVNCAITRVTGFTPDELYGDPASALKIVHPDDRAIVHDLLAKGTGLVPIVVRWMRKDGSVVWVEQRNTPIF